MNRENLVIVSDCDVEFLWKFPFRGPLIPKNWLKKSVVCISCRCVDPKLEKV